jgi:outer membrane protein OmpA-like peptidoglycan-associated protein
MKKHITFCIIATALITINLQGQEKQAARAQDKFNSFNYSDAIASYEDLIAQGFTSEEIYKNLGDANYSNANYEEASKWYSKLLESASTDIDPEYLYRYAQTLKSLKDYKKSDIWMKKFEEAKSNDLRAKKFNNKKYYLSEIKKNSGRYTIKNLSINSTESDFSPAFYANELIFSSARDSGLFIKNVHLWDRKSFLNLYQTTVGANDVYSNPEKLSKEVNKKAHESSPVFTKDGKTMYFTRNNSKNGSFSRDEKGVSRLKIYKASLLNNQWADIKELPFNSDEFSHAHPSLNADETRLYFASNRPGSLGESDIFYVEIKEDNSYGNPINVGSSVNTEARETFPFISESNVLYFASDGHPGLGGLDVFGINLEEINDSKAKNLGEPLNSEEDDFSYIINESTKKGYFASNRKEGLGGDDIYSFYETKALNFECDLLVNGIIKDVKGEEIIAGSNIKIVNDKGETTAETISNSDGSFSVENTCQQGQYTIVATKMDYNKETTSFAIKDENNIDNLEILLSSSVPEFGLGADLVQKLNLEIIYFDFDKSNIRRDAQVILEKVVAYLKQYPRSQIKIGSHTDSRGNDAYNLTLSDRRANATMKYLIAQGIDASRLAAEGYGETKLINNCDNGAKCSSEQHQLNRRSEFIVVK